MYSVNGESVTHSILTVRRYGLDQLHLSIKSERKLKKELVRSDMDNNPLILELK